MVNRLSVNIMEFDRPDCLDDIGNLGLTLPERKLLLARVQQEVVAAQFDNHAMLAARLSFLQRECHVKDWRPHRIATLFGEVRVRLPRFLCCGCGRTETGVSWPSHCRSTPALDQLQARLSALMTYRVAADILVHLLPVDAGKSPETLRSHTLQVGEQLGDAAVDQPSRRGSGNHGQLGFDLHPQPRRWRAPLGGPRRQRRDHRRRTTGVRSGGEG